MLVGVGSIPSFYREADLFQKHVGMSAASRFPLALDFSSALLTADRSSRYLAYLIYFLILPINSYDA
jgi:hypothetical protein